MFSHCYRCIDANRFGAAYLAKLGWFAGSGLGAGGEGRNTHIKVEQKLDMLGIGRANMNDPNGLAWKQNRDFENLLKRLNGGEAEANIGTRVEGFARAGATQEKADEVLGGGKFAPGYKREYFEGCAHGFTIRGDLSDPKVVAGREGAFKASVEWLIKYL